MDDSALNPRSRAGDRAAARPGDIVRQVAVISATCFMIVAALVGTGLLGGTAVQDLQGGALDTDGSYLAPAGPAFSIWSAIYAGLVWYTVWQALPSQRTARRQRAIGWWIAASAVLNGLWLVAAQYTTLPLTVAAIVALLVVLCIAFRRTVTHPADGTWDAWLIDVTTGLHLGWVSLATVANTAAWLTAADLRVPAPQSWGVVVVAVVAVIGMAVGYLSAGRFAPAVAIAWGLGWLAFERLTGEPPSAAIGIAAIVAGVLVLAVPLVMLARRPARKPEAYARVP